MINENSVYFKLSNKMLIDLLEVEEISIVGECIIEDSQNPYNKTPDGFVLNVSIRNGDFLERIEGYVPKEDWEWIRENLERIKNDEEKEQDSSVIDKELQRSNESSDTTEKEGDK